MDAERNRRVAEAEIAAAAARRVPQLDERGRAVPRQLIESYTGAPTSLYDEGDEDLSLWSPVDARRADPTVGAARLAAVDRLRTGTTGTAFGPGYGTHTAQINPVTGLPYRHRASPLPVQDLVAGLEGGSNMDREYKLPAPTLVLEEPEVYSPSVAPDEIPALDREWEDQKRFFREYNKTASAPLSELDPALAGEILRNRQMAWRAGIGEGEAGSISEFLAAAEAAAEGLGDAWISELVESKDPDLKEAQTVFNEMVGGESRRGGRAYWEDLQRRRIDFEGGDEFGLFDDYYPGALPAGQEALRGLITPQMFRRLARGEK